MLFAKYRQRVTQTPHTVTPLINETDNRSGTGVPVKCAASTADKRLCFGSV